MRNLTDINGQENKPKIRSRILKKELIAFEILYRRLVESTNDGNLIPDAETRKIIDVNLFLIDLPGYSKKEFNEKSIWENGAFHNLIKIL